MEQPAITDTTGTPRVFAMEHRWGHRMACRATARLSSGGGISGTGRVRDISSSGAFIETALELPVNARLVLVMPGNESAPRDIEVTASVVRLARDGVGVEWCETPAGSVCAVVGCKTRCAAPGEPLTIYAR